LPSISGELEAGEAAGAARAVGRRQRGSVWIYYVALLGSMGGFCLLALGLDVAFEMFMGRRVVEPSLVGLAGLLIGWFAYIRLSRPWTIRRFRRRMADRGLSPSFAYSVSIEDEVLAIQSGGIRKTAEWASVTEMFKAQGYWVFLVQMEAWYAPARLFSDSGAERAFVAAALARMTEGARTRSPDAVAFSVVRP
jgi:hypothetical protein